MKKHILSRIIAMICLIAMLSETITPAYGIIDLWSSAGGAVTGGASATTKGVWTKAYQGFRITVLDWGGEPAFTFNGKDHMDLLFNYPYKTSYSGVNGKLQAYRNASSSLDMSTFNSKISQITINDIVSGINSGGLSFDTAGDTSTTLSNFKNIPYHLVQENKQWKGQGKLVKNKMYGPSDEDLDDNGAFYLIFNLRNGSNYLWQPKKHMACIDKDYTEEEIALLTKPKESGGRSAFELISMKKLVISVEPILWNQLRISESQFSKYSVYGTQTDIGFLVNWMKGKGMDMAKAASVDAGGYDRSLFGKIGRKALVLTKTINFKQYVDINGKTVKAESGKSFPYGPPSDSPSIIDNTTVMKSQPGWSVHLYATNGEFDDPNDKTHTYDKDNYPTLPPYKEHPAPDPSTDSWTKDKWPTLPETKKKYNIVKFYEVETLSDSGEQLELKHVSTHERLDTLPVITIEDEVDPGGYKVIEWKWSKDPKPDIYPELEWWSDPIESLDVEPDHKSTDETRLTTVDITWMNGDTPDETIETTLYVRLRKPLPIPETSTTPNDPPPGTPPSPPPDPKDPTDPDPQTDHDPDSPYCHYRIVKLYDTENEETGEITVDHIFTRYPTNPIVLIEDEGPAPGWSLIEWCYGDEYRWADGGDEYAKVEDIDGLIQWEELIQGVNQKEYGTTEKEVNLIDKDNLRKVVTLYVHLRKTKKAVDDGVWEIYESQLSRTLHTNNKKIGTGDDSIWGDYKWELSINEDFPEDSSLTAEGADNEFNIIFNRIGNQDKLEIKKDVHEKTDPKVYSKDGVLNKIITELTKDDNKFEVGHNGEDEGPDPVGMEYVTVTWRGADGYKDLPTLAKYKEQDIKDVYGEENYEIPKAMLGQEDRKSLKKRASDETDLDLSFEFGIDEDDSEYDGEVISITEPEEPEDPEEEPGDPVENKRELAPYDDNTKMKYKFEAPTHIYFYAGVEKETASEEPTKNAVKDNSTGIVIKGDAEIKFFPYIKMTFMDNILDNAKREEKNTKKIGYKEETRKDTYVLSEYESGIIPYDVAELYWYHPNGNDNTIKLTSQQWSTHKKATQGGEWRGANQVLPGGAIYEISTDKDNPAKVVFTTYNTIVDEKARKEYLTAENTIPADKYTTDGIAEDLLEFINEAKTNLDNLKIVQWVNNDYSAETAWNSDFDETASGTVCLRGAGESLANLGSGMKANANTEEKYYMRQQTGKLADYVGNDNLLATTASLLKANKINSKDETSYQGDLDVTNVIAEATVLKVFSDTEGKVYSAVVKFPISADDDAGKIKDTLDDKIEAMKDINADKQDPGSSGATINELITKAFDWEEVNSQLALGTEERDIDDHTMFITNIVKSLTRNEGNDFTAHWANRPDGKWYNEAFDGIYMVKIKTTIDVAISYPAARTTALDPALCPQNQGQADLYTTAFLSQFCLDSKSDSATDKPVGYLGTYKEHEMCLPNIQEMYKSRKFYIPNANVQDLN